MCRFTLLGDVGGPYNWGDLKRFAISQFEAKFNLLHSSFHSLRFISSYIAGAPNVSF